MTNKITDAIRAALSNEAPAPLIETPPIRISGGGINDSEFIPMDQAPPSFGFGESFTWGALTGPVPPAGGEPVIYALSYYNDVGGYSPKMVPRDSLPEPETREGYVLECDHRTHVTRLQAEVADVSKSYEALAHVYAATQKGFEKMQSELTKARELLRMVSDKGLLGYMKYDVDDFLSNQSAPADKGQGEPVARVRHSPVRKRLSVELLRSHMKDGDLLYAEQPATVKMCNCNQGRLPCECK